MTEEAEEDCLNPIGFDFWIGQLFVIVAAVGAVWWASRAGFREAARFAQYEECVTAQKTLKIVRAELEENLREVRATRERVQEKKPLTLELKLEKLQWAAGKSFGSRMDPTLFQAIEMLFGNPLPGMIQNLTRGQMEQEDRDYAVRVLTRVLDRAQKVVLPMLESQERILAAAESRLVPP